MLRALSHINLNLRPSQRRRPWYSSRYLRFFSQQEDGIRDLVRSRGSELYIRDRPPRDIEVPTLFASHLDRAPATAGARSRFACCPFSTSYPSPPPTSVGLGCGRITKKKTREWKTKFIHRTHCDNYHYYSQKCKHTEYKRSLDRS